MLSKVRNGDVVIENRYDYMGRRVEKRENGAAVRYVYGGPAAGGTGWLVLEVRDGTDVVMEAYTHGLDLSGTLEGAGGIGGILSVTHPGATNATYFCHYDGNGNVVRLTDTNGAGVSTLDYTPFGRVLASTGPYTPRYQFSTKEYDGVVRVSYYGYRFYGPNAGRFLSRDPLGDVGFVRHGIHRLMVDATPEVVAEFSRAPYLFTDNNPARHVDPLGLDNFGGVGQNEVCCVRGQDPHYTSFGCTDCASAAPTSDSKVCDIHEGIILSRGGFLWDAACVCRCAGVSDWDNQVRGCLACAQAANVHPDQAHNECYKIADEKYGNLSGWKQRLDIFFSCQGCRR